MNVDIVMLSHSKNNKIKEMTKAAIASLHKSSDHYQFRVFLIETSPEEITYEGATVIHGEVPFNYNRNLNLGVSHCTADWIVLANNDLIFHKDWLDPIIIANADSASPVSPGWQPHAQVADRTIKGFRTSVELCGWCIVVKRTTLEKIGKLDETFDFFYQDNDYAAQLMKHQLSHVLVGASKVSHLVAQSHGGYHSNESKARMLVDQAKFAAKYDKSTICLTMMVRDESANLKELLPQVAPLINCWSIVDTGSLDDTKQVIKDFFEKAGIPGELHERPWTDDYGLNRTEMMQFADGKADYMWVMDADDRVIGNLAFKGLLLDSYSLAMGVGFTHWRHQVFRSGLDWKYIGERHEYAYSPKSKTSGRIAGDYHIDARCAGFRSRNPNKYLDDAAAIEKAILKDPNNARNWFYLAQSYFDAKNFVEAKRCYTKRVELAGWPEECFYAQWRVGLCAMQLKESDDAIIAMMLKAYEIRPARAESLHTLAEYLRLKNKFALAYIFAKTAAYIPFPEQDVLFLFRDVYKFKALDELGICAYYTGRTKEAIEVFKWLLDEKLCPPEHMERTKKNLEFALTRQKVGA